MVPRRGDAALKIYHADVQVAEGENLLIPFALMERSQMAAVSSADAAPEVEAMLVALHAAVRGPTWRCESLLFLLPPTRRGSPARSPRSTGRGGCRWKSSTSP